LPAYWLWRHEVATARRGQRPDSLSCLLALACVLVLLFPVVSATDDLHAMRAEMEEPGATKRTIQSAASDKASTPHVRLHAPPAALAEQVSFSLSVENRKSSCAEPTLLPAAPLCTRASRAPPFAHFA